MKTLTEYLNDAKAITGSDGRTAAMLGVTRSAISIARKKGSMDADHCIALAGILRINPGEVLRSASVARKPENARYWAVASVIVSVLYLSQGADSSDIFMAHSFDHAIYYTHT